jgi:dolichol-phosphate mannosyltransferase
MSAPMPETGQTDQSVKAEAARFSGFLVVGGVCTLLNLAIVYLLTHFDLLPYLAASIIAWEATILLNFALNDRLTFRALAAHAGSWIARLLRFHGAYLAGEALAIALGAALHLGFGVPAVLAQAISVGVATLINFASVRFWAYRTRSVARVS